MKTDIVKRMKEALNEMKEHTIIRSGDVGLYLQAERDLMSAINLLEEEIYPTKTNERNGRN